MPFLLVTSLLASQLTTRVFSETLYSLAATNLFPIVINFFFFSALFSLSVLQTASSASEGALSLHFYSKTKQLYQGGSGSKF